MKAIWDTDELANHWGLKFEENSGCDECAQCHDEIQRGCENVFRRYPTRNAGGYPDQVQSESRDRAHRRGLTLDMSHQMLSPIVEEAAAGINVIDMKKRKFDPP